MKITEPDTTPNESEIDDGIMGTARIDPKAFGAKKNTSRFESLKYAIAGLIYMFRHEKSVPWMTLVTVVALVAGLWLQINEQDWALVLIGLGIVWAAEFLNSAVEAVVDMVTDEFHPMAKVAKDVSSSAVLVGSLIMFAVLILVLAPPLLERLG